jgi:adenylate cyclase class 1
VFRADRCAAGYRGLASRFRRAWGGNSGALPASLRVTRKQSGIIANKCGTLNENPLIFQGLDETRYGRADPGQRLRRRPDAVKIGYLRPLTPGMASIGNHTPPPAPAQTDIETRFLAVNQDKLRRLYDNLSQRQCDFLDVLPLLFHGNQRSLPGYISRETPSGVCEYAPGRQARKVAARISAKFDSTPLSSQRPLIKGLYLMGSPGTIAFSKSSDLDIWLVHDPDLDQEQRRALTAKAQKIERYAANLDLEVHFFIFDAPSFRAGTNLNLSAESSGSSQHHLLLDEFYRSGVLLAGLKPLWWCIPPAAQNDYARAVSETFSGDTRSLDDYVDFGDLDQIPADEFFGVALWHLYKSIESPYKSLLKLLLMETYAAEYPQGQLLSHRYKEAVYRGDLSLSNLDPYIAMYRKVEEYLLQAQDKARLDLTRRSFYLKTNIPFSRPGETRIPDWQKAAIEELIEAWAWDKHALVHLDNRSDWKVPSAIKERRVLIKALGRSYATLSKFAKQHAKDQRITQTDLNVLGRKLYAAFERKPSKIDIVTRGICPNPIESEMSLIAAYKQGTDVVWSLFRGGVSPEQAREAKPLVRAGAPAELLAWCHFNHIVDKRTNWRIFDIKQSLTAIDIRKVLEAIEECYPNGDILAHENATLAVAPRPLRSLLMINVGVNPLSGRINNKGVLTSNRTDAFQFGGQGINLVRSADLLMMTSWEEVFVFHFDGNFGLAEAMMEYIQWGTPLGTTDLPPLQVCCLSKDYSQAIKRRVEDYATSLIELLCRPEPEHERQLITQFEQHYCRVFAKKNRPAFEMHRGVASLVKALSTPRAVNSTVTIDEGCGELGALRLIFAQQRPDAIQLYVYDRGNKAEIFVLDEFGALFTTVQECFRVEMIFDHYVQFFQALFKHYFQRDGANQPPQLEMYRLKSRAPDDFKATKISATMPRDDNYLSVRVFVDMHKGGAQQFTIFCEDEEFTSAEHGGRLFVAIAEYVFARRGKAEKYPIFITDLELSNRFRQHRQIDTLQTIHVLNYKKRIEYELTRALHVDVADTPRILRSR